MDKKDEMFVLCEMKHYIDCILNSLDALRKNPDKETQAYLYGFIDYCKGYIKQYANEYADYKDNELKDDK